MDHDEAQFIPEEARRQMELHERLAQQERAAITRLGGMSGMVSSRLVDVDPAVQAERDAANAKAEAEYQAREAEERASQVRAAALQAALHTTGGTGDTAAVIAAATAYANFLTGKTTAH